MGVFRERIKVSSNNHGIITVRLEKLNWRETEGTKKKHYTHSLMAGEIAR